MKEAVLSHGRGRLKRGVAIVVAPLLVAGAVGYFLFRRTERNQRAAREVAFADLSQCLLGDIIADPDAAGTKITWLRLRAPDARSDRWPTDGVPWPQSCGEYSQALLDSIEGSSLWDNRARETMWTAALDLSLAIRQPDAIEVDLAPVVEALWRGAKWRGVPPAQQSLAIGPRAPTERLATLALPFSDLKPAWGGPAWLFFAPLSEVSGKLAACSPDEGGLRCWKYPGDPALFGGEEFRATKRTFLSHRPFGEWEVPAYVMHSYATRFHSSEQLLHDGRLEEAASFVDYVDANGTQFGYSSAKRQLAVRPRGEVSREFDVIKLLDSRVVDPSAAAKSAAFVARGLAITVREETSERRKWLPVSAQGEVGMALDIPDGDVCRAGSYYLFESGAALSFVDATTMSTAAVLPLVDEDAIAISSRRRYRCSASGAATWLDRQSVCLARPARCVRMHETRGQAVDTTGDRIILAWKSAAGLVAYVGGPGLADSGEEHLVLGGVVDEGPEVFGYEHGALIVARMGVDVVGVRITPSGDIVPIEIRWE